MVPDNLYPELLLGGLREVIRAEERERASQERRRAGRRERRARVRRLLVGRSAARSADEEGEAR
jgi:hypothetical protein